MAEVMVAQAEMFRRREFRRLAVISVIFHGLAGLIFMWDPLPRRAPAMPGPGGGPVRGTAGRFGIEGAGPGPGREARSRRSRKPKPPVAKKVVLPAKPKPVEPKPKPKPSPRSRSPSPSRSRRRSSRSPNPGAQARGGVRGPDRTAPRPSTARTAVKPETQAARVTGPAEWYAVAAPVVLSPEEAAWRSRLRIHRPRRAGCCSSGLPAPAALETQVRVKLDARGNVVDEPRIERGSGNPWYDESTIRAIQKASPAPGASRARTPGSSSSDPRTTSDGSTPTRHDAPGRTGHRLRYRPGGGASRVRPSWSTDPSARTYRAAIQLRVRRAGSEAGRRPRPVRCPMRKSLAEALAFSGLFSSVEDGGLPGPRGHALPGRRAARGARTGGRSAPTRCCRARCAPPRQELAVEFRLLDVARGCLRGAAAASATRERPGTEARIARVIADDVVAAFTGHARGVGHRDRLRLESEPREGDLRDGCRTARTCAARPATARSTLSRTGRRTAATSSTRPTARATRPWLFLLARGRKVAGPHPA